jgi:hypothetical protein
MTPIGSRSGWAVLATLGVLVILVIPELGSDPWPFRPSALDPRGLLGPLVRAADRHWDLGAIRTPGVMAGVLVALVAAAGWRWRSWHPKLLGGLCLIVALALLVPAVLLQVGLRQASEPWYYVNDSTYQIELAGDLLAHGDNPYGHDYSNSGLEQWYPAAGFDPQFRQVALRHFAYFPGAALSAAAWRVLPQPLDDYRVFLLLATAGLFGAFLLFRGPLWLRLALGVAAAANPLAVRAVWFGTADAPSLLCLVLAFALVSRRRLVSASVLLALAILLKQFALVALPFFALMLLAQRPARRTLLSAGIAFIAPLVAGIVPFLIADPGAFWRDTITYGGSTYRIVGYGLSNLLLEAGIVDDRWGAYPFLWLALFVWLPLTLWLLWNQWRLPRIWSGAAGFAVSIFVLFFVSRVFQTTYLIWPLIGVLVAVLLAHADEESVRTRADVAGEVDRGELQPITTRP